MDSYIDYIIQILPIAVAHIALPPISYFNGERLEPRELQDFFDFVYSLAPNAFLRRDFINSLLCDSADGLVIKSTTVTHLFVHGNYSHLLGNILAILQFAYPVYNEFGTVGLYFLFISGGAIASLPTFLHSDQKAAFSNLVYDRIAIQPTGESYSTWIPGGLRNLWNKSGASRVANLLGKTLPTKCCGSSGACCALMGCDLTLLVRDCVSMISQIMEDEEVRTIVNGRLGRSNKGHQGGIFEYVDGKITRFVKIMSSNSNIYKTIFKLANIYQGIRYCCTELETIYPMKNWDLGSVQPTFLEKAVNLFCVGHAAHVQGFLYGASFGITFGILLPSLRRRKLI